jgi:hypothetical protein
MNISKQVAGFLGGNATFAKYGREHFQQIGKKGAKVLHHRYKLEPVDLNDFALVNRKTGEIKALISGRKLWEP